MTWFLHQVNYKGKKQQKKEEEPRRGQAWGADTSGHRVWTTLTRDERAVLKCVEPLP